MTKFSMVELFSTSYCKVAFAFVLVMSAGMANSETVNPSAFTHSSSIRVGGYTGSSALANFPLMIKLAENSPVGFSYADCEQNALRFADADGNILPHEIDTWNPNGTSVVWVRVPELSGTSTQLTM